MRRLGRSYTHSLVVMIALPNDLGRARIGIAAGKSIGGAVKRNRAKRMLRAATQTLPAKIAAHVDIVFLARRPMLNAKSIDLEPIIDTFLKEAKVF